MSSISSITKMVSGLSASQRGLQVTGHNISNINTKGYTRQQLLQHDSPYITIGKNGEYSMQVGSGVSQSEIRQIRDSLADKRLRTESSVLNYYQTLTNAMSEIEAVFDEPHGDTITGALSEFWSQAQKLNTAPDGVEERLSFISTAKVLIGKINDVSNSLRDYQDKINDEVTTSVHNINSLIRQIRDVNEKIAKVEQSGHDSKGNYYKIEEANDFRDERNLLLDELSTYGNIDYYEEPDGRVLVKFEGQIVVSNKFITEMKLETTDPINGSHFNRPVWEYTDATTPGRPVYDLSKETTNINGNDTGKLKGLLIARGDKPVTYDTKWDEISLNDNYSVDKEGNSFFIPKIQKTLGEFTNKLTTMVNECFDGTGIGSSIGEKGVIMFIPINCPSTIKHPDASSTPAEWEKYKNDIKEYLVPGNIQINPKLLEEGGYNHLGTVTGDINNTGSNEKITEFLGKWESNIDWFTGEGGNAPYPKTTNITDFFSEFITDIGTDGSLYAAKSKEKNTSVMNIENERLAISGVSQDEEFSNMIKYQHAYNASARMITMLDGMLDVVINKL